MALVNRVTTPQEFFDITSAVLLTEPDDQFVHAKLMLNALKAQLAVDDALGFDVKRAFGEMGEPFDYQEERGRLIQSPDPIMAEAVETEINFDAAPGHTIRLNRPAFSTAADSAYTQASREIASGVVISKTPVSLGMNQVPVTVKRFAGPTDGTAPAPLGVERFDAQRSLHKVAGRVGLELKRDFTKTLDTFGRDLLNNTGQTVVRPAGATTDDLTGVVAGDHPMSFKVLQALEKVMDEANVGYMPNGKRPLIMSPYPRMQLSRDPEAQRFAEYHKEYNPLFKAAYWRTVGTFDIFWSNRMTKVANNNTVDIYYSQAFGPKCIGCGLGEQPRTAYNTDDNYGEHALVVWLAYMGLATLDSRHIFRVATS